MPEERDFFDYASDFASQVGNAMNPFGSLVDVVGKEISAKSTARERLEQENMPYNDPYSSGFGSFAPAPVQASNSGGSFLGNIGSTLGDIGRDIGGFFSDVQPLTNLLGVNNPMARTNSGSAQTVINQAPQETSMSGEILGANLGLAAPLMQAGRQLFRSPGGQTALGFGAGAVGAALMPSSSGKPRITRRMKRDVRKIYMMAGMDPAATAQILNNLGTYPRINFNASVVFFILTKRFRNDGPVVTKAAVRKTKTTLRRMKGVVDMYNSVCKPTARRAPARRAAPKAVQLIKN